MQPALRSASREVAQLRPNSIVNYGSRILTNAAPEVGHVEKVYAAIFNQNGADLGTLPEGSRPSNN